MAGECRTDFYTSELKKFNSCRAALKELVYEDSDEAKKHLKNLLDELISIEYSLKLTDEQVIGEVLVQCCRLVPLKHDVLVTKVCHLASNMLSKQQLIMTEGTEMFTEYLIEALKTCQGWTYCDILRALGVVLYENGGRLSQFHSCLLGTNGYLLQLATAPEHDIAQGAMQCIENICMRTANYPYLDEEYHKACFKVMLEALQAPRPESQNSKIHARIMISCLRGINCIIVGTKSLDPNMLGPLLAALKVYMLYGLPGMTTVVPRSLVPTPLSKFDPSSGDGSCAAEAVKSSSEIDEANNTSQTSKSKKGKKRRARGKKTDKEEGGTEELHGDSVSSSSISHDQHTDSVSNSSNTESQLPFQPWSKLSSSDSEFSESDTGQSSKLRMLYSRIRECALSCFHAIIKAVDRRLMFGYWPSFIPDTPGTAGPTLFTGIMKDPSPKIRTGALIVLTALVDGSKQFLMAAEEADQYRNAPFTPFSVNLGHMIKEIHRCLLLALVSESSSIARTQIIKCLATLIPNVPYHRLRPGLLTRVLKQIYPFIYHRDTNSRVTCLTCLGSIATVQAPLVEVVHLLQTPPPVCLRRNPSETSESATPRKNSDSGYQSNHSYEAVDGSPQVLSPHLTSGSQSPMLDSCSSGSLSWVIKLCVKNVAPHLLEQKQDCNKSFSSHHVQQPGESQTPVQPLPIRLESLQNLAILAKNYFFLLRPCLFMMRDVTFYCLKDPEPAVKLHGAKLLEELGAVILQQYSNDVKDRPSIEEMTDFWIPLLNGPLPNSLQTVDYYAVKSAVCDCLANIGPQIFDKMPSDKYILCITLMLGLCSDPESHVRAAAIRTLGVYVLYPCLRQDLNFVADVAKCVINGLQEPKLSVRVKAAWSLGNLSDALVLNRNDNEEIFMEDFSDVLLLKLFEAGIQSSRDNDKVKSNAVRALGNLLRYLPERSLKSSNIQSVLETGIQALVKNISTGSMKVRWNACYATANMFRNHLLPVGNASWTESIFTALCSVIQNCKNFKVRINAALTFSVLSSRRHYGDSSQYCRIWQSLVISLETAENITDFTEYRYRDNLTEQVCSSLVHMFTFLEHSDLKEFCSIMESHHHCLCTYIDKYKQLLQIKDDCTKISEMAKAQDIAQELTKSNTDEELCTYLRQYIDLFSFERPAPPKYDESQMTGSQSLKSGFKQTYD